MGWGVRAKPGTDSGLTVWNFCRTAPDEESECDAILPTPQLSCTPGRKQARDCPPHTPPHTPPLTPPGPLKHLFSISSAEHLENRLKDR